ncbi:MAG: hypothetical protein V4546_12055 [Bacteroidota bacterium]
MDIEYLPLDEGQWLSDTDKFKFGTPSNYIIFKILPNKGATHGEIKYKRNSIIIEFNTPVLEGKRDALEEDGITKMYPNILVVYQGVEIEDVITYLENDITPKKILCTPNAYSNKVKEAITQAGYNIYNDFFILIDECHKMTTDVDFAEDVVLPIDDFFQFKEKAMISATALPPSDPRFIANGFKILKVKPNWDYKKQIMIIDTNNIIYSLIEMINHLKTISSEKIFIFLNCTDLIHDVIKAVKVIDESRVFCADPSVTKLKKEGYFNVSSSLSSYEKVNALTSRFFSAVDMKLINEKPHVIMVTHVYKAPFTMLDPYADSIQIEGRLRNGISSLTHISNFNRKIEYKLEEDAKRFILNGINQYKEIENLRNEKIQGGEVDVTAFDDALKQSKFCSYIKSDNSTNYFKVDNYVQEQQVLGYYKNINNLKKAYLKTEYFIPNVIAANYTETDKEWLEAERNESKKAFNKRIAESLHKRKNQVNGYLFFDFDTPYDYRKKHPEFAKKFDLLGYDKMSELNFDDKKISSAYDIKVNTNTLKNEDFIKEIQSLYKKEDVVLHSQFLIVLEQLYEKYGIKLKVKASHLTKYYTAEPSKDKYNKSTWVITGLKHLVDL